MTVIFSPWAASQPIGPTAPLSQEPQKEKNLRPEVGTSPWVFPGWPVAYPIPSLAPSLVPDSTTDGFCSLLLLPWAAHLRLYCLSVSPATCLATYLPALKLTWFTYPPTIYLYLLSTYMYLSIYQCFYLYIYESTYLPAFLPTNPFVYYLLKGLSSHIPPYLPSLDTYSFMVSIYLPLYSLISFPSFPPHPSPLIIYVAPARNCGDHKKHKKKHFPLSKEGLFIHLELESTLIFQMQASSHSFKQSWSSVL